MSEKRNDERRRSSIYEMAFCMGEAIAERNRYSRISAIDESKLDLLFELLTNGKSNTVPVNHFLQLVYRSGLRKTDPRLSQFFKKLSEYKRNIKNSPDDAFLSEGLQLTREQFQDCIPENYELICQALEEEFVIPEFQRFTRVIEDMYTRCKFNTGGHVADYIPQLARMDLHYWYVYLVSYPCLNLISALLVLSSQICLDHLRAVSVCTVDGQRFSIGDCKMPICLQCSCKPLNYAIALNDLPAEEVHQHVGQEPSGRSFNELSLDVHRKPHNPLINAGAIATVSLLKTVLPMADRYDYVYNEYRRLAGGEYVGFSNSTFLSERETADRNFALAYYMQENKVFPKTAKLRDTLDLYFQLCSIEVNADSVSVMAATLANGGVCPITGEHVLSSEAVRNTLSLMHSCGMYDYSGQFAFKVGLPAKSGVSGIIMLVVPNVMGICTWSPALDKLGNSVRGIQFCEDLVSIFNFHNYDNLLHTQQKYDPRRRENESHAQQVVALLFSAYNGDVSALRRFHFQGIDVSQSDYDGRTALHLGSAEGHLDVVKFLLEGCHVNPAPKDRWAHTPLDDAAKFERSAVEKYLNDFICANPS